MFNRTFFADRRSETNSLINYSNPERILAAASIKQLRPSIKKTLRPGNGKLPLSREKQERYQREHREKDWQRELPNIFDEAWRGRVRMFGDCFHEQVWGVADVSQCAKKGGA